MNCLGAEVWAGNTRGEGRSDSPVWRLNGAAKYPSSVHETSMLVATHMESESRWAGHDKHAG